MLHWLKLSQHDHSGRLRPHEHTSYLPLCILLFIVGVALTSYTAYATSHPGPESGSIGLTGTVPGKPPTVAATIRSPTPNQHFSTSPVPVSGSCPPKTLVEIFKNDIFAGSTVCSDDGVYSVDVDLLIGKNVLVARVYDELNQPGPDSNEVVVFYDALGPQGAPLASLDFGGAQLLINTDTVFRGIFPQQNLSIPIDIIGGSPPYAVNIQWGDSTNKVVPRNDTTQFTSTHAYNKPGTYQVSVQASDAMGHVGFLAVAVIVNGQPAPSVAATTTPDPGITNKLLALWPLYVGSVAVVGSFWLGERREKYILHKKGVLTSI